MLKFEVPTYVMYVPTYIMVFIRTATYIPTYRVLSKRHHFPGGQENNSVVVTASYLRGGAWEGHFHRLTTARVGGVREGGQG